jgi:hypothetical protein
LKPSLEGEAALLDQRENARSLLALPLRVAGAIGFFAGLGAMVAAATVSSSLSAMDLGTPAPAIGSALLRRSLWPQEPFVHPSHRRIVSKALPCSQPIAP